MVLFAQFRVLLSTVSISRRYSGFDTGVSIWLTDVGHESQLRILQLVETEHLFPARNAILDLPLGMLNDR